MLINTESKAQGWRAVAMLDGSTEALLYVGRSSTQVRGGYIEAFEELLETDERDRVTTIKLQQWQGAPDAGKWQDKATLRLPQQIKSAVRMAA
jgi:hypothetical protein